MIITEENLLKIAFAAYGNSPVRGSLSLATWRYVDGWSSLNYSGSDKEIFAICINDDEVEIFTDSHGINHLAVIRKMEELKLIENTYEQMYGKRSDKKEVKDIINSTQFYGRSEDEREAKMLKDKFENKSKEEKIDLLHKAIDAIIDAAKETNIDYHYFVDSCESVVMKLRSEIFRIENE